MEINVKDLIHNTLWHLVDSREFVKKSTLNADSINEGKPFQLALFIEDAQNLITESNENVYGVYIPEDSEYRFIHKETNCEIKLNTDEGFKSILTDEIIEQIQSGEKTLAQIIVDERNAFRNAFSVLKCEANKVYILKKIPTT